MRAIRIVLGLVGAATIGGGGLLLLSTQRPDQLLGFVLWLIGAILVHDGILAPIVLGVGLLLRRAGRRIPWAILGMVQAALIVGAVLTLVVAPEIYAQSRSPGNPTVLVGDYAARLVGLWAVLGVLVTVAAAGYLLRRRRRRPEGAPA
ncbi:MAG: conserved rane protein [Naasia sp.]|jgi:hypothetical protein|uniref:hypothetical protein n=1 Tax=Naasia sp. TaxID=2546198 RepID=UPI00263808CD|nr:hypothetical protein [Naasia sp.]MCU1569462.1 conserved rane protein [Naasia sp.]